jgi:hypothetical protein
MSEHTSSEPLPDEIIEPAKSHGPSGPRRILLLAAMSTLALGALMVPVEFDPDRTTLIREAAAEAGDITVMTFNQALGADLGSLLEEPSTEINAALLEVLEDLVATDFPARAERQAG